MKNRFKTWYNFGWPFWILLRFSLNSYQIWSSRSDSFRIHSRFDHHVQFSRQTLIIQKSAKTQKTETTAHLINYVVVGISRQTLIIQKGVKTKTNGTFDKLCGSCDWHAAFWIRVMETTSIIVQLHNVESNADHLSVREGADQRPSQRRNEDHLSVREGADQQPSQRRTRLPIPIPITLNPKAPALREGVRLPRPIPIYLYREAPSEGTDKGVGRVKRGHPPHPHPPPAAGFGKGKGFGKVLRYVSPYSDNSPWGKGKGFCITLGKGKGKGHLSNRYESHSDSDTSPMPQGADFWKRFGSLHRRRRIFDESSSDSDSYMSPSDSDWESAWSPLQQMVPHSALFQRIEPGQCPYVVGPIDGSTQGQAAQTMQSHR